MRKAPLLLLLCLLAACTPEQIASNKAKAVDVLGAINSGVKVAASTIKEAIDGVCANGSSVSAGAMTMRVGLGTQSGPNTRQNLENLDRALAALNDVCSRAAANPNDPALKSLLRTAVSAYNSATAAQSAAAKGG